MEQQKKTYTVKVVCRNCNFTGEVQIGLGVLVAQRACTNCGCASLKAVQVMTL